jgi:hypothetical protein
MVDDDARLLYSREERVSHRVSATRGIPNAWDSHFISRSGELQQGESKRGNKCREGSH